jgi:hypothetical protein
VKKYPVVSKSDSKRYPITTPSQPIEPHSRERDNVSIEPSEVDAPFGRGAFLSFRYSYTEISAAEKGGRIKSKRAAYENGCLVSESFEGEIDRVAYRSAMDQAQRSFAEQATLLMRSMFPFLR